MQQNHHQQNHHQQNHKFKNYIVNYVQTTEKIKSIQQDMKKLREKLKPYEERKHKLSEHIVSYMSNNKKESKGIKYHNYKLTTFMSKRTQTVSKEYLEQTLTNFFKGNKAEATKLLEYIYSNRKVTITPTLRQTELKNQKPNSH